jgi:hypothetical protein
VVVLPLTIATPISTAAVTSTTMPHQLLPQSLRTQSSSQKKMQTVLKTSRTTTYPTRATADSHPHRQRPALDPHSSRAVLDPRSNRVARDPHSNRLARDLRSSRSAAGQQQPRTRFLPRHRTLPFPRRRRRPIFIRKRPALQRQPDVSRARFHQPDPRGGRSCRFFPARAVAGL